MPVYEYKHIAEPCEQGLIIEVKQSMNDKSLEFCPYCQGKVNKIFSRVNISTPTGNTKLKEKGFTKLVRRDKGVYENVTATKNESRYFNANDPSSMPDIKKKISD